MYLNMSNDELSKKFEEYLLETNRDYRYYIDWNNINCLEPYSIEIHAMDVLIRCKESDFKQRFSDLITKLPSVIEVFPFLFALDKKSRKEVVKDGNLKICSEIGSLDYGIFNFNRNNLIGECSDAQIDKYYDFFVNMGLKDLFQNLLEKSVEDYIIGILVGLDSNGRKNRGGKTFEFACEPIITQICNKYNLDILKQKNSII